MNSIALILIASFAIDRLVTGLFFLFSFSPDLHPLLNETVTQAPVRDDRAARTQRLIYSLLAGYLGTVIVAGMLNIRLFAMSKYAISATDTPGVLLDTLLTGLILAAGADRLAEALKLFGGGPGGIEKKEERSIEISGKLVLERQNAAAE